VSVAVDKKIRVMIVEDSDVVRLLLANIIDADAMRLHRPTVKSDLPAGGRRLDQTADGYIMTMVSGEVIAENGEPTEARPGKLIRGRQAAPATA